ncbi:MAG TPA: thioredoxin domain-containing protein, partial [Allosphingosinicella sp.]
MKRLASAFLALGLLAAAPAAAQAPAVANVDWSQRVATTPEGGFRMGNPDAPVKLVEFLSLTCSHCADFSAEAMPSLIQHVRSGRVSVEYRNYVLNHYDLAAAVLSRCAAPGEYFALNTDLFAQQSVWAGRAEALTAAQRAEVEVRPTPQSVARTADLIGLKQIAAAHGITAAEADRCLASADGLSQVMAMRDAA